MNQNQPNTLPPAYFDAVYGANADPWNFETSPYEREKYAASLAALPREAYANALEIGCSIGVFTHDLAARCRQLVAIDVSATALDKARQRCADLPQVRLEQMTLPQEFPAGQFDLITLCEVGYYWDKDDLARAADRIVAGLIPGGQLLLVHWLPAVHDYPLTGDEVHEFFLSKTQTGGPLRHVSGQRQEQYRLDILERV